MTIHLPKDLETSLEAEISSKHFSSADNAIAEIVRDYFRRRTAQSLVNRGSEAKPSLGSIGARRDSADELDEIVADAMRKRRSESWRVIPGE